MSRGSENPTKRKGVGGTGEKRNEAWERKGMRHVPPGLLALRLRSAPTLVPRFGAAPAASDIFDSNWHGLYI